MALVTEKNIAVLATDVTSPAYGDGSSGFVYGNASWMFYLKEFLKNKIGATITITSTRTSGTGTDANDVADSDLWTDVQQMAYGLSYFGFDMPTSRGVTRSFLIQRGPASVGYSAIIKQSWAGPYNIAAGGTPTVAPSLPDEEYAFGSAGPVYQNIAPGSSSYIYQCVGYSDDPRAFLIMGYPTGGGVAGAAGVFVGLDPFLADTYDSGNDDAVFFVDGVQTPNIARIGADEIGSGAIGRMRAQLGLGGEAYRGMKLRLPAEIGSLPSNPRTSKRGIMTARWGRDTSPEDTGGESRLFKLYLPSSDVPRTGNLLTTKDKLIFGPLCVPWDGSEPT